MSCERDEAKIGEKHCVGGGPKVLGIVQARMGSSRLPGKVLASVAGRPMLEWQLRRLRRSRLLSQLVVATTDLPEDDAVAALWSPHYRGSSADVLGRFVGALDHFGADVVVRMTGDSPLLDPALVDQVVSFFIEGYPRVDYVSNGMDRSFPRGMDVEVFKADVLRIADREARDPLDREHCTRYIYRHPEKFVVKNFAHRFTVDTQADLEQIRSLFASLGEESIEVTYPELVGLMYSQGERECRV